MAKKISILIILIVTFLHSLNVHAEEFKYAEIFDPKQNKVVKVVQVDKTLYNIVANWINNINGIYGKNDPLTEDGYAIKIPIDPAIEVHGESLNALINEVYIIVPESDPPFFIIFEDLNKLICFPFNGNIDLLSRILEFNLKTNR